jgi:uncharacterized iron-regulated membrane protein
MAHPVRRIVSAIHLWSGLLLGAWFVLLGLTGSALVFYLDCDEMLNPQIKLSHPVAAPQSAEAIHHVLRSAYPGRDGPWRIELPLASDMPVMARYTKPDERAGRHFAPLLVTLVPDTLQITSSRFWGDTAMTWIYDLHYTLLLGKSGLILVGIVGLLNALMLITGVYLWWPSRQRMLAALRVVPRPGAVRFTYDLHVASGIYTGLLLIVVALTGSALAFPDQTRAILAPLSSAPVYPPAGGLHAGPGFEPISLDRAIAAAKRQFPDAEVRWIETSGARGTPISLRLYQPFEPSRRFPQTRIWLDPATGAVLAFNDPGKAKAGDTVMNWIHPLHNGEAFGLFGRSLLCFLGIVPLLLFVTGIVRWRQKARARRAVASQKSPVRPYRAPCRRLW